MLTVVDPKTIEKWLPIIEGKDDWSDFVSACPKVSAKDYGMMSQLFENIESLTERTNSANGTGDYSPILIPMMRRVMPAMIGPRIFGTQPMNGPSGLMFILRAVFGNDSVNALDRSNSVILTVADSSSFAVGGSCSTTGDAAVGTIRHIDGNNMLVQVVSGTFVASANIDNAASFVGAETTISAVYENEALFNIIFPTYAGPYSTAAGESLTTNMKEISFNIEKQTATATTKKLKAKWTNELEEDLRYVHKLDAETILSGIASDEVIMEMNREMINKVITNSTRTSAFDYSTADGRYEFEKYQNLAAAIGRAKRSIATVSKRGQGTYMIISPGVLNALEASGRLDSTGVDPVQNVHAGRAIGMDVFVDLYASNDTVYVGYKGSSSEMDAGVFYGPYIPLQVRKGYGEEDMQPRSVFSTRYALINNPWGASNYFHALTVANLPA